MNPILSMLSEDGTGASVSTMRVATLLVILFVLAPRLIVCWQTGAAPEVTNQDVALILGALGMKAAQRSVEAKA
jgi:hypothetical protein